MNTEKSRIVREELWRSVVWLLLGFVGWSILIDEVAWLDPNLFTALGLPAVTWAVLTAGMIGIRTVSGAELQSQVSASKFVLSSVVLIILTAAYLIRIQGYSPLLVIGGEITATTAAGVWYWYTGVFDQSTKQTS
ncbi:MAG: hypothetical protein J07HX5_00530 [halophilic archaeon J07HX5]|nr:MAG: hypothetical protein J07HX5_00530 [halophilic archaeon J07HX5]